MRLDRAQLLADTTMTGDAWCRAHTALVDRWLADLWGSASGTAPAGGISLVAVGGYGRSELCPGSDVDVLLLHDGRRKNVDAVAHALWYPIWDGGIKLGHGVATARQALATAGKDLDSATALLDARHIAGDDTLTAELAGRAVDQWRGQAKRWLSELADGVEKRQAKAGEVAFRLEPDLKDGRGGLRDVHSLHWAERASEVLLQGDAGALKADYGVLLRARVELQRRSGRHGNVLLLEDQDGVAAALGFGTRAADDLMAGVAAAARRISWISDDAWRRVRRGLAGRDRSARAVRDTLPPGLVHVDGEIGVATGMPVDDPVLGLRATYAAAARGTVVERGSLDRLAATLPPLPDPWPDEARELLVGLLRTGRTAIRAVETLDQRGLWVALVPEWEHIRSRPQRNAYHRFTVDRHLLETAANAAALCDRVDRPDLLVVGALLHDMGKGRGGDHTEVGMTLVAEIGARMGFPSADVGDLVAMVEHHLLLPDAATRRDLDDPVTADKVAAAVGTVGRLRLLAALTEADSLATGASAWGPWKAGLVSRLVELVAARLRAGEGAGGLTGVATGAVGGPDPGPGVTEAMAALLDAPDRHLEADGDTLRVATEDRAGVFSRVAGVLALHGLEVVSANAASAAGRAACDFRVAQPRHGEPPWDKVRRDLDLALDSRLALPSRVAARAAVERGRPRAPGAVPVTVTFHDDASDSATVIDVQAPNGFAVLYRITRAMAELDLDIRSARVQTLGAVVLDAFYVRTREGAKVTERSFMAEIERAVVHSLSI